MIDALGWVVLPHESGVGMAAGTKLGISRPGRVADEAVSAAHGDGRIHGGVAAVAIGAGESVLSGR